MSNRIFFSWQADTPNKIGRSFLKNALGDACSSIASDTRIEEALRDVIIDSDTQGVAGQPPIAETIFKKIDVASVFLADVTFTGKRIDNRPTPNPNVLIEYGWAQKALTSERVICIMNTAFGSPNYDTLPFDLAHLRWPITYNLPFGATAESITKERKRVANILKSAIQLSLQTIPTPATPSTSGFSVAIPKNGLARFRAEGEAIGYDDNPFETKQREVFLSSGPAMWLRLSPLVKPQREWSTKELKEIAQLSQAPLMPLFRPSGGYGYVRASDGEGMYLSRGRTVKEENDIDTESLAFAFKTGEIWSIDTRFLKNTSKRLYMMEIEEAFARGLQQYAFFLKALNINEPYRWAAGLFEVKGRQIAYPPPPGHQWLRDGGPACVSDIIEAEGEVKLEEGSITTLLPLFKKIFAECGLDRPDYLPQ